MRDAKSMMHIPVLVVRTLGRLVFLCPEMQVLDSGGGSRACARRLSKWFECEMSMIGMVTDELRGICRMLQRQSGTS